MYKYFQCINIVNPICQNWILNYIFNIILFRTCVKNNIIMYEKK